MHAALFAACVGIPTAPASTFPANPADPLAPRSNRLCTDETVAIPAYAGRKNPPCRPPKPPKIRPKFKFPLPKSKFPPRRSLSKSMKKQRVMNRNFSPASKIHPASLKHFHQSTNSRQNPRGKTIFSDEKSARVLFTTSSIGKTPPTRSPLTKVTPFCRSIPAKAYSGP